MQGVYLICTTRSYFNVTLPGHYIAGTVRKKVYIDQGRTPLYRFEKYRIVLLNAFLHGYDITPSCFKTCLGKNNNLLMY